MRHLILALLISIPIHAQEEDADWPRHHVRFSLIENEHRIRQAVRSVRQLLRSPAPLTATA